MPPGPATPTDSYRAEPNAAHIISLIHPAPKGRPSRNTRGLSAARAAASWQQPLLLLALPPRVRPCSCRPLPTWPPRQAGPQERAHAERHLRGWRGNRFVGSPRSMMEAGESSPARGLRWPYVQAHQWVWCCFTCAAFSCSFSYQNKTPRTLN